MLKTSLETMVSSPSTGTGVLLNDFFNDNRASGKVIGSCSPEGNLRQGVDIEGVIGVDGGALRIQPLLEPGWGRAALAYGPFPRQPGLAFSAFYLNGHNTSQTGDLTQSLVKRLQRWLVGSQSEPLVQRLSAWVSSGRIKDFPRQVRRWQWLDAEYRKKQAPGLDENLAVGWFPVQAPRDPIKDGSAFVMHASGPENGELWAVGGANYEAVLSGVQNIPLYTCVMLRPQGAAFYAASLPGANGLNAYPLMRPLAIQPFGAGEELFAVLTQSVMGQIGFRVDTRVYGIQVQNLPEYSAWYGTAHAASRLTEVLPDQGEMAELGNNWQVYSGVLNSPDEIDQPSSEVVIAILDPGQPTGLLHVQLLPGLSGTLIWRFVDPENHWRLEVGQALCNLLCIENGSVQVIDTCPTPVLNNQAGAFLQVLDDGHEFRISLNGETLFGGGFHTSQLGEASGVGLLVPVNCPLAWRDFEAHPRQVPAPANLPGEFGFEHPFFFPSGKRIVVQDTFDGTPGDLAGRRIKNSALIWQRELGKGQLWLDGQGGVSVRGSVQQPNPGRTAYSIPWGHPRMADISVEILPPGSERGQGEKGRGGLLFWQDPDNYLIVSTWLDDDYQGASISSFYMIGGFEELYDAVWTNVGKRIRWGVPYTLRVVFDSRAFTAYVNDEPVLYRAIEDVYPKISQLQIRRVGLVANWEWGNDTGSQFRNFIARE